MQNISWSNVFGKFFLIVCTICKKSAWSVTGLETRRPLNDAKFILNDQGGILFSFISNLVSFRAFRSTFLNTSNSKANPASCYFARTLRFSKTVYPSQKYMNFNHPPLVFIKRTLARTLWDKEMNKLLVKNASVRKRPYMSHSMIQSLGAQWNMISHLQTQKLPYFYSLHIWVRFCMLQKSFLQSLAVQWALFDDTEFKF